jgi:hypothetical protein
LKLAIFLVAVASFIGVPLPLGLASELRITQDINYWYFKNPLTAEFNTGAETCTWTSTHIYISVHTYAGCKKISSTVKTNTKFRQIQTLYIAMM